MHPGFLSPEDLLLNAPFIQLLTYQSFLLPEFLCDALISDLDLQELHLVVQLLLGLKDVSKGLFVPELEALLKVF